MKIVFRWYGKKDNIPLKYIAQIPNIYGVVSALDVPAGEVWSLKELIELKEYINSYNLQLDVIESVNVHESIKLGDNKRDIYIENYIQTLKNLAQIDVKTVCYNFMPVFDWTRTSLVAKLEDGSTTLKFDYQKLQNISPQELINVIRKDTDVELPGWELSRLITLEKTIAQYKNISKDQLRDNLKYFLERIIPVAKKYNINMAIHPDDPPFKIFELPKIASTQSDLQKILDLVSVKNNGITLCTGSLAPNSDNNITEMIKHFGKNERIHFGHVRNIKTTGYKSFYESSHYSKDGDLDVYNIIKAYHDIDFKGYIRPDHGRMIWGEKGMPGYGLYDRALGVTYLNGLIEAIEKQ